MSLTLGTVTFRDFEIPDKINFGGRQALQTHKLPGGARVIDAMGRDDDSITWQGRFRSNTAGRRARQVDAMRIAGLPVTLAWDAFRYTVVIEQFQPEFQQAYEIPYTISCVIVTSSTPPDATLADALGLDLSRALGLPTFQEVADAVQGVQGAIAAAKALRSGFPSGLSGVADSITAARGIVAQATGAADLLLANSSPDFATNLLNQAAAMTQLNSLQTTAASLGRMAASVRDAV